MYLLYFKNPSKKLEFYQCLPTCQYLQRMIFLCKNLPKERAPCFA